MDFKAVRATIDLAGIIGEIQSLSWRKAYKGLMPDDFINDFTPEDRAADFERVIMNQTEELYLFLDGETPVGMAVLHYCDDADAHAGDGEIKALYIHPDHWSKGYGTKALDFSVNRLKERGFDRVVLWVLEENHKGRKFYEQRGFKSEDTNRVMEIGETLHLVKFSKDIS